MGYPFNLEKVTDKTIQEIIGVRLKMSFSGYTLVDVYSTGLNFYPDTLLIKAIVNPHEQVIYFLLRFDKLVLLDFTNHPIYQFNSTHGISLNKANAVDYIRFFFSFVKGQHGFFYPLMDPADLLSLTEIKKGDAVVASQAKPEMTDPISFLEISPSKQWDVIVQSFVYPQLISEHGNDSYDFGIMLLFKDSIFHAVVSLDHKGMVKLSEEQLMIEGVPFKPPMKNIITVEGENTEGSKKVIQTPGRFNKRKTGNTALAVITEILLKEALSNKDGTILFTSSRQNDIEQKLLKRFANMINHARPVVVFESNIPYIEEEIAHILLNISESPLSLMHAEKFGSENGKLKIPYLENSMLLTISLHAYNGIENEHKIARDITVTDSALFIGCSSFYSLPHSLRELTDYVLRIPDIDHLNFGEILSTIFNKSVSEDTLKPSNFFWANMLLPNDIIQAVRLNLPFAATVDYLEERVTERMKQIIPVDSPSLKELHGLGEAKAKVEDLMHDIKDANTGKISWQQVDKGLLIVGPPGTGKTTLAKALAKECDVRFIHVSASEWQNVDHLGQHIARINADFARARRYAPCIMFIDEFDSIGSRENQNDRNSQYQNMVINTLLQEIQGFVDREKVIIIGATNFEEYIDPALRRAGRLDRTVHVTYPNVDALQQIYKYYLAKTDMSVKPIKKPELKHIAGLSFGLTGADVEQVVRGAARRARKEKGALDKKHLLDEIMGKPGKGDVVQPITPEEMKRIAVHEAGHTLLRLLDEHERENLAYVSIVPRNNGKLGFVASLPSSSTMLTKKQYFAFLQFILGGRAAEELVFGTESISSGAGGDENSDLAKATRLANKIVTQFGFGIRSGLYYSKSVTPEHTQEASEIVTEAYESALEKLNKNRELLHTITDTLLEKQEITGADLINLLGSASK
jgi:ATP-dependent Zn protease